MRGLKPIVRVLLETGANDAVDRLGDLRLHRDERRRLAIEDCGNHTGVAGGIEWPATRDHFVEDRAEGEQIAPMVGFLAFELFRRHVFEGAEHGAVLRERHGRGRQGRCRDGAGRSTHRSRQAEIEELGHVRGRGRCSPDKEDIRRFQIAVDDAAAMRPVEGVSDFSGHA